MKTTELRIGNIIYISTDVCTVTGILPGKIFFTPSATTQYSDFLYSIESNAKPIPLSEHYMTDFGFKYSSLHKVFHKNGKHIYKDNIGNWWLCDLLSKDGKYFITKIKYVHQLQNLYQSLKGSDLIYTKQ